MNNTIETVDLTRLLPPSLRLDPKMTALAEVIAGELQKTSGMIQQNVIYPRIDELDEKALDILAYDLHVDWYDYTYPLDVKRRTIKDSVKVHRRLGTKYAVETALGNVFPGSRVEEWFAYGGKPYFFRVVIDTTTAGVTADKQAAVLAKIKFYKNLRSHLDAISFQMETRGTVTVGAYQSVGASIEVYPYPKQDIDASGTAGLVAYCAAATTLEVYPYLKKDIEAGGAAGLVAYNAVATALEIYPFKVQSLDGPAQAGVAAISAVAHIIEIFPQTVPGE